MKVVELRRHTANDGDVLTVEGVIAAVEIGQKLDGPYDLVVSSGAQRATQAAACFLAGMREPVPGGVVVDDAFRSDHEDHWREIHAATKKPDLEGFLVADYSFVQSEATRFGEALHRVVTHIPDGGRALIVGHSPMLEAAAWAVTGEAVRALPKGEAVVLTYKGGVFSLA